MQHILKRTNTSGTIPQKLRSSGPSDASGMDMPSQEKTDSSPSARQLAPALVRNDGSRVKEKK